MIIIIIIIIIIMIIIIMPCPLYTHPISQTPVAPHIASRLTFHIT